MWVVTQRGSCEVPFNTYKSISLAFLVFVVTIVSFITKILSSNNVAKRDAILLEELIETNKNCYPLIWLILNSTRRNKMKN